MSQSNHKVPWLTLVLIGLNLVSAFVVLFRPDVLDLFAFNPQKPNPLHALTSLALHVNEVHLLGNLIFLAAVGPVVEFAKGPLKFAIIYLFSGFLGVLAFWIFANAAGSTSPLVGASGAIAGCVGYCAIRFLRTKVAVFVNVAIPVGLIVGLWVALQAGGAMFESLASQTVDSGYWPHLGGFLGGLLMAGIFGADKDAKKEFGHAVLDKMNERGPAAALTAANQHLQSHPKDQKAWWQKIQAEIDLHELDAAGQSLQKLYELTHQTDDLTVLEKMAEIGKLSLLDPILRLKKADALAPTNPELAEKIYRSLILQPDETRKPEAILALALLLKDSRPAESKTLAESLVSQFELHPATESAKAKGLVE